MDFTLDEDQQLLVETARALLSKECPVSLVRAHIDDPGAASGLISTLAGWASLAVQPLTDLCLFLEETGAVLAPGPLLATTALYVPTLLALDDPAARDLAERASAGDISGTVAVAGPSGDWIPHAGTVKRIVLEAGRADHIAVVSAPGPTVAVYERPPARQVETLDPSRLVFEVDLTGSPTPLVAPLSLDHDRLESLLERASVALSAELLGTTRWMLETSLAYACSRHQFGKPIGSFQAIKHKLANMALMLEQARAATFYAAMAIDAGDPDRHRAAHVAKIETADAARLNLKESMQIHGGVGYTFEHDLHLYMRRAIVSQTLLGSPDWHRDRLADLVFSQSSTRRVAL